MIVVQESGLLDRSQAALANSSVSDFVSTVGEYALIGLPPVLLFWLLGTVAARMRIEPALRFLGFVWAAIYLVFVGVVMISMVGLREGLVSAAMQTEVFLLAGIGWWLGARKTAAPGDVGAVDDAGPLGQRAWYAVAVVALLAVVALVVYWIKGAA
jgi:hypothetical protein